MLTKSLFTIVSLSALLGFPCISGGPCSCSTEKTLPERECGETDDVVYYRRVFDVDVNCQSSVNNFYQNLFHEYKGESKESYVKRIDTILTQVYSELDCRTNVKQADLLKKYYECKYAKRSNENDEKYFTRVLTKSSESSCNNRSKLELLRKYVKKVDWSKVEVDESSQTGFVIKSKSTSGQKKSTEESQKTKENERKIAAQKAEREEKLKKIAQQKTQQKENERKIQEQKTLHEENERKIAEQKAKREENIRKIAEQKAQREENVKKIKEQKAQHEENVRKIEEQKVQHQENLKKIEAQKVQHEENVRKIEEQKAQHKENLKKIEAQKNQHEKNVRKIEEQKAQHQENVKKIEAQKVQHEENVRKIEEQKAQREENIRVYEARKAQREANVRKWIKANYRQKQGEDVLTWYKRICTKNVNTDAEYVERLSLVKNEFPDLDLWYKEEYLGLTRQYYTTYFTRTEKESEEEYYKRLTSKETNETEDNWAKRINLIHDLFPSLPLWCEEKYYETYTKEFYTTYYKQQQTETNEAYLKRVFTKINGESESNFWKRITLTKKTFASNSCWEDTVSLKKLEVFKNISNAKTEEELKWELQSENSSEWKSKYECLKTFFSSISSSTASHSSSSTSTSSTQHCGCNSRTDDDSIVVISRV